jgi:DNA repair photolyase
VGGDVVLPGMRGLLRTVRPPEFAGMTFHEVEARSALNKVPGGSRMPFTWTINPYRGCSHACTYCVVGDTSVLLADGRSRPIGELRVGDEIYGTELVGSHRRYLRTTVSAHWSTMKPAFRMTLADGTELIASGDHRFLTERGWKHQTDAMNGRERPYLTTGDSLLGPGGKWCISGDPVTCDADLAVAGIEPLGVDLPMFDITTGTGDFIANGVVSHNCFARNTHTYLDLDAGDDFDRQVVVKVNIARVLERELRAPKWRCEPVAMGTNTDPYQRAEGRYRLMPGVIGALGRSGTPFSVLTKGTLLARDLPELVVASGDVHVGLGVSIALADRDLQARLEPGTPSPAARLDLVRRITDAGLRCGVMVAPVLPLLTDSDEALDALLGSVAGAGASGATVLALHLRPGTREWFMAWLAREYPALVEPYGRLYSRGAYVDRRYRDALAARVAPLLRRHGLVRSAAQRGLPGDPEGSWPRGSLPATRSGASAPPDDPGPGEANGEQLSLM